VKEKIRERIGLEYGYRAVPKSREHLLKHQPKPEELPARSMVDSYTTATLALSTDVMFRERYINHLNRVRLGRLIEELDMFAVWLCHRHITVPQLPEGVALPYSFVTLLVDKVEFSNIKYLKANQDIAFSGFVSWTGKSSMELIIYVRQHKATNQFIDITKAIFLMVARNATNTGPAPVNPLKPANEKEQEIWQEADARQKQRRKDQADTVFTSRPQEHEYAIMYGLLQRTTPADSFDLNVRQLPPKCRWMSDSQRSTNILPFPESRNAQNTIFGGYIMRQAVEISFIMASIYVNGWPLLKCISDISFMKPVMVQSIVEMTAHVVYTSHNYIQIMTVARLWNYVEGTSDITNVFYLTYRADKTVDEVLPGSYREMLWYIHGRRKFLAALNLQPQFPLSPENIDASQGNKQHN
ncbi:CG1774, partial [Drosophila busckii]